MKRSLWIAGGLAVIPVGAAVTLFLASSPESGIEAAVETLGSEAIQAKVALDAAEISPASGEGALRGFLVGNPEGFETPSLLETGEIRLKLDVATVTERTLVIEEILVWAPRVTLELGPEGSNIEALGRNIARRLGAGRDPAARRLIVDSLVIRDGVIAVSFPALRGGPLHADLPEIRLTGLGREQGGATAGELAQRIAAGINQGVGIAVAPLGLEELAAALSRRGASRDNGAAADWAEAD